MNAVKISIGEHRTFIVVPADQAGVAASLLACGQVFEADYRGKVTASDENIIVTLTNGSEFAAPSPQQLHAESERDQYQRWWSEERAKSKAMSDELIALKASLAEALTQVRAVREAAGIPVDVPTPTEAGAMLVVGVIDESVF